MTSLFSTISNIYHSIETFFVVVAVSMVSFFGFGQEQLTPVATSTPVTPISIATSSPPVVPVVVPKPPVVPVVVPKPVVPKPVPVPPPPPPPVVVPIGTIGVTTIAIQLIPLLSGGVVHAGQSVPISYLQMTNIGAEGALLTGFWVTQTGSAPGSVITGLSTVDDKGGSRGSAGGNETAALFQDGKAFAPTNAYFAPGQMRLFTIKATLSQQVMAYIGMQVTLVVSSIEAGNTTTVQGQFPIPGTTWTIAQ